jgi:hypothetical protein
MAANAIENQQSAMNFGTKRYDLQDRELIGSWKVSHSTAFGPGHYAHYVRDG